MSDRRRIAPLAPGEWSADVAPILEATPEGADAPLGSHNIFRTLARHPDLFRSWLPFGGYLLTAGTLPASDRELLILRTAVNCRCSYEWGQHVRIALDAGLAREQIDRVLEGPAAAGWNEHEAALLRAADELHQTATLSDKTWDALARDYDERKCMEATMLVGQYHLVAFALNAFGVQLDEGLESLPASS